MQRELIQVDLRLPHFSSLRSERSVDDLRVFLSGVYTLDGRPVNLHLFGYFEDDQEWDVVIYAGSPEDPQVKSWLQKEQEDWEKVA